MGSADSENSLSDFLTERLQGEVSLGEIESRIKKRFDHLGWNVSRSTLSRLRSGVTQRTDREKLLLIAWAMDLDVQQTNEMLHAGRRAHLEYYYRKRTPAQEELFAQWPELAQLEESRIGIASSADSSVPVDALGNPTPASLQGDMEISSITATVERPQRSSRVLIGSLAGGLLLVGAIVGFSTLRSGGSVESGTQEANGPVAGEQEVEAASPTVTTPSADTQVRILR